MTVQDGSRQCKKVQEGSIRFQSSRKFQMVWPPWALPHVRAFSVFSSPGPTRSNCIVSKFVKGYFGLKKNQHDGLLYFSLLLPVLIWRPFFDPDRTTFKSSSYDCITVVYFIQIDPCLYTVLTVHNCTVQCRNACSLPQHITADQTLLANGKMRQIWK